MKTLKVLYLVGVVFCSLLWTVGAMAGERVLIFIRCSCMLYRCLSQDMQRFAVNFSSCRFW
jgi:hypothetical protein